MRILALVTDSFGGHGGIALYNRDLLTALCAHPECTEVVAVPRLKPGTSEPLPEKLTYLTEGINSRIRYISTLFKAIRKNPDFSLIICGHINLLPVANLIRLWLKKPIMLEIYGVDAWSPTKRRLANYLVNKISAFISISELTEKRFLGWAGLKDSRGFILPNAIHNDLYGPGSKNPSLLKRYDMAEKTVLMTLGRLHPDERQKGFDEVMELLPDLSREIPNIAYLIAGDGRDRPRLERKAESLGVAKRVIFAGHIAESEKVDHYRLADTYVMPGCQEGFGFVYLEAMACGVPVVASKKDGSREAVRNGKLGIMVDPANPAEIKEGIRQALNRPRGIIPEGLEYFSYKNFSERLHHIINSVVIDNKNHYSPQGQ